MVDKRLYLPESWTSEQRPAAGAAAAGAVPDVRQGYQDEGAPGTIDDDAGECQGARGHLKDPKQVLPPTTPSQSPHDLRGCDLQRPQGEGVRGARSRRHHRLATRRTAWTQLRIYPGVPERPRKPKLEWTDSDGPWSSAAKNCRSMPDGS